MIDYGDFSCFVSRVVGGLDTLDKMEAVETDDKERPKVRVYSIFKPDTYLC